MKAIFKYIPIALVALLFAACESQWDNHIEANELRGKTLMQMLLEHPNTTVFASIVEKAGYDQLLSGDKALTVFSPSNESLSGVDMNDVEGLKAIVRNHLAYAHYTLSDGLFSTLTIEMINSKRAVAQSWKIGGIEMLKDIGSYNLTLRNGIMHIIDGVIPMQNNIWEYLHQQTGNLQAQFILEQDRFIMDMEKSIQIGVDPLSGKPLYDTVWINTNPLLEAYPINDEAGRFTFVLLPNSVVNRIETKYAKYFAKEDPAKQDSIVRLELIKDCVLLPVELTSDGRYSSVDGVLMDITIANIQQVYQASNGAVYTLSDADVKIYENKVKTIHLEGEDYFSYYSNNANSWMLRYRPTLSEGKDMVLNAPTTYLTQYVYTNPDTTINVSINRTFYPMGSSNVGNVNNMYIEFRPVINSVPYKLYWSAYNDYSSNINLPVVLNINNGTETVTDTTYITNHFSQKLLISFPDKPRVSRNPSTAFLENNFSTTSVFASKRIVAGVQEEKQLFRCITEPDATLAGYMMLSRNLVNTSEDDYFNFFTGEDGLGNRESVINPTFGEATIFVANTTETRAGNSGMIFLDYLKLVPVVDPNE